MALPALSVVVEGECEERREAEAEGRVRSEAVLAAL